ncbi:MAG: hypothetical protein R2861_02270 [Desulfobacterales bacterium]
MGPIQNPENQNLEKRIKRHVIAKPHRFFAATLPGLEARASLMIFKNRNPRHGCGCHRRYRIYRTSSRPVSGQPHPPTINRLLMWLGTFTAANFRQLEKKLDQVPWELFVTPEATCMLNVTSKQSRLIHTKPLKNDSKQHGPEKSPPGGSAGQRFPAGAADICPVHNDRFTVSMDSSGDRWTTGVKTHGGRAPVRETMAAAILMLAGYDPAAPLIDPMCGSGTFSLEAAMMAENIPAGWFRDFAFMDWPAFKAKQWQHIRQVAEKSIISCS